MRELFGYSLDHLAGGTYVLRLDMKEIANITSCDGKAIETMLAQLNGKRISSPRVREFVSEWLKAWQKHRGTQYVVTPQDGATLKRWADESISPIDLVAVAVKAWKSTEFEAKFANSIANFVNHYNEICAAVKGREMFRRDGNI